MAAYEKCGASDSVISHTSVSEELQVPLLLFSISFRKGVLCKRIMTAPPPAPAPPPPAQYHHSALPQSPEDLCRADTVQCDAMRMERNERREALMSLFPFHLRAMTFI